MDRVPVGYIFVLSFVDIRSLGKTGRADFFFYVRFVFFCPGATAHRITLEVG
jgi:hypothetical protein